MEFSSQSYEILPALDMNLNFRFYFGTEYVSSDLDMYLDQIWEWHNNFGASILASELYMTPISVAVFYWQNCSYKLYRTGCQILDNQLVINLHINTNI